MDDLIPISIGVDVGQVNDPTAVVVAEVRTVSRGLTRPVTYHETLYTNAGPRDLQRQGEEAILEPDYTVRFLERLPLGTSYIQVARRISEMLRAEPVRDHPRFVSIDVTGVGRPVYEMLAAEIGNWPENRTVSILPITFVHGNKYDRRNRTLGKAYLVSRMQALLQRIAIHAPDTAEVRAMLEELKNYEIRIDQDGNDTYGVFKVGKHDDLATALGLACLEDEYPGDQDDAEIYRMLINYRGY